MSRYAWFACTDCKVMLWLGKAVFHDSDERISRVGHQRVALTGTFPMAPLQTARESFDLKQLSSGLFRAPLEP